MGKAVFRASTRGARRAGYKLSQAGRVIQGELLDEFGGNLNRSLTRVFREFAPHDSGRLERDIKARVGSRGGRISVEVEADPVSDEGYHYIGVTRFGHRQRYIYPKPPRRALRFRAKGTGRVVFASRVRGYKPPHDWAERAADASRPVVSAAADRIGRQIASRIL